MIVPDANLLLYAYNQPSPLHCVAAAWWSGCLAGTETLGLAPVVAFGFVRIAASSRAFENPLSRAEAAGHVRAWLAVPAVRWIESDLGVFERALDLLEACGAGGSLVADAQVAALAMEHSAVVHPADADFARFAGVRWHNPLAGSGPGFRSARAPRKPRCGRKVPG